MTKKLYNSIITISVQHRGIYVCIIYNIYFYRFIVYVLFRNEIL
jgi:hypothetical protein